LGPRCRELGFNNQDAIRLANYAFHSCIVQNWIRCAVVHPQLDPAVRRYFRDTLLAYTYAAERPEGRCFARPEMQANIAEMLFRCTDPDDAEALETSPRLYWDAIRWAQDLGYADVEADIREGYRILVEPELQDPGWPISQPSVTVDVAKAGAKSVAQLKHAFALDVSRCHKSIHVDRGPIRDLYGRACLDYGGDADNAWFVETYLNLCQKILLKHRSPKFREAVSPEVVADIDTSLCRIVPGLKTVQLWKRWYAATKLLEDEASEELRTLVHELLRGNGETSALQKLPADEQKAAALYIRSLDIVLSGRPGK
jgi:hypothetical protein